MVGVYRQTNCASIAKPISTLGRVVYVPCWNRSGKTQHIWKLLYAYLEMVGTKGSTSPNVPRAGAVIQVSHHLPNSLTKRVLMFLIQYH